MSKKAGKNAKTAERRTVEIAAPSNGGRFCRCKRPLRAVKLWPSWRTVWKCSGSMDLPEECTLKPEKSDTPAKTPPEAPQPVPSTSEGSSAAGQATQEAPAKGEARPEGWPVLEATA